MKRSQILHLTILPSPFMGHNQNLSPMHALQIFSRARRRTSFFPAKEQQIVARIS